jgi:hypothetical protein
MIPQVDHVFAADAGIGTTAFGGQRILGQGQADGVITIIPFDF